MANWWINLNCDCGESFGRWVLSDDRALLQHVPSANIACGFHAGGPTWMRRTVEICKELGNDVGAHPALPDLIGFGRRRLAITPEQLHDDILYQISALAGFARAAGVRMTHVKPHGILYTMCGESEELARAVLTAVKELDPELMVILPGAAVKIGRELGLLVYPEGYCDLNYHPNGYPVVEPVKVAWDPEEVARRAIRIVREKRMTAVDGTELTIDVPTLCLRGDFPGAGEVARIVRERLAAEDIEVVPLKTAFERFRR